MRKPAGKRRVMADCSNDFKRFLYANYPDDYRRATAENAPDDVVTTILSRHENHYKIWRDIPEWIKSRYRDIIPTEVLNGNENVRGFVEEEEQKLNQEEKETRELMDYTVTLLALGYAAETAAIMAANREQRMLLLKEAGGRPLNAEQAAKWRELRESDRKAIEADWKNSQTEKYILHLAKCIDRERRRMLRSGTETEEAAAGMKLSGMENELRRMTAKLADKNVQKRMADYLRQQPQQAALRHLSPETMKQFGELLKKQGINISPVQEKKFETVDIRQENVGRDSLAQSLKNHFEQCRKTERILCEKYQHQNQTFSRASAKETAAFHSDDDLVRLIALRRAERESQRS